MSLADRPELARTVQEASREQIQEIGEAFLGVCYRDDFLIDPPMTPPATTHAVKFDTLQGDVTVRVSALGNLTVYDHTVVDYSDRLHKRVTTVITNSMRGSAEKPKFYKGIVASTYFQQQGSVDPVVQPVYGNPEDKLKRIGRKDKEQILKRMSGIMAAMGDMFSLEHYDRMLWLVDQFSLASVSSYGQEAVTGMPTEEQ